MVWIIRLFGAVLAFVILAAVALWLVPIERIATLVTERLSQQTGRTVQITGDVSPQFWPSLGLEVEGIEIANPDWAGSEPMLRADQAELQLSWGSLFTGDYTVERASLSGGQIALVRRDDGVMSWDFGTTASARESADRTLMIGSISLADMDLRYADQVAGQIWDVADFNGSIEMSVPEQLGAFELAGTLNGSPLTLGGVITDAADFLALDNVGLDAQLAWEGGTLDWNGRVSATPVAQGDLALEATDLTPLVSIFGAEMPELPKGLGQGGVMVAGQTTLSEDGSIHLRQGRMVLDETAFDVALDLTEGAERPMLRASVTGGEIVLPGLLEARRPADAESEGEGWPRTRINVDGLFATDAEITIVARELDLGTVSLSEIASRATLERGRLVFDIERIEAYGGQLAGRFVINGRGGLSVGGDLVLADADLQPLLSDVMGYDRLQTTGSASLEFLGVGNDLRTIMDGLEGEGDISLGAGSVVGLDLAGMIQNFDLSHRAESASTLYDRATAEFRIRDGIVLSDDLLVEAPWGEVRGEGSADLEAMSLAYRLTPGVMRGDDGEVEIRVPILIEGPWASPGFRPDLERLAELELAAEAARLEEQARARVAEERERVEAAARAAAGEATGLNFDNVDGIDDIEELLQQGAVSGMQRLLFGNQ